MNDEASAVDAIGPNLLILWSQRRDSNPRPPVYENCAPAFFGVFASLHLSALRGFPLVSMFPSLLLFSSNRVEKVNEKVNAAIA